MHLTFCWLNLRAKYGMEYKGDYRLDGGGTTRPLSTQRCNCRPACRRPFSACSTAPCVWLLAVQAAATHSACVPPRALCSRVPSGALPSSLHAHYHCFGPAQNKNCHADAPRIHAARPPFIPAAIYLHLSSHTTQ